MQGESISTPIPDDARGIEFEIGRMQHYVREFQGHPLVVKTARRIVELCNAKDKTCEMETLFQWTKDHYRYVNDPINQEVIQTPVSQLREIMTPPDLIKELVGEKLIGRLFGFGVAHSLVDPNSEGKKKFMAASCFMGDLSNMKAKTSGDCDEGSTFLATMLAAIGIKPRFRFGGSMRGGEPEYYHVWIQGQNEMGEWIDMDVTEQKSTLGWFHEGFTAFGVTPIF